MKKKEKRLPTHFLLTAVLLVSTAANAQDRHLDTLYSFQPAFTSSDDVTRLTGEGSYIRSNPKTAVSDAVMLYPFWLQGVVNFKNGTQARNIALKFNLLQNELYFDNDNKMNRFADTVTSFSIFDTSNQLLRVATFANGYPHLGQKSGSTFYLVLATGPQVHLLKYIAMRRQDVEVYGGSSKTEYTINEELLVYDVKDKVLKTVKNNTAALIKALPRYSAIINSVLKNQDNKKITDEQVVEVIKSINNASFE